MVSSGTFLGLFNDALGGMGGFKSTDLIFANEQAASSLLDRGWSITFSGEDNTNALRDRMGCVRLSYNVSIRLSHELKLLAQNETLNLSLDDTDIVVSTLMRDPLLRRYGVVEYLGCKRSLYPTGNYIINDMEFTYTLTQVL